MPFVPDTPGKFVPDAAPTPTGVGERALNLVKDVAATPFRIAGTAADVGSRLASAIDPGQAGSPSPNFGEHNFVPAALQHAPNVEPPGAVKRTTLGGELLDKVQGPLADTVRENAGPAATLVGAVAGAPGAVRGGAAAFEDAANAIPGATTRGAVAEGAARRATAPTPIQELNTAGYKFRPSDVQARNPTMQSVPGSLRESITSSPEQTQQIIRDNSALSTKLIGEDIGVPNATKLTPQHYAEARLAPGADYDRVGAAVGTVEKPATGSVSTLNALATDQSAQAMPAMARAQAARIASGLESGQYAGPQLIKDISYFRQVGGISGRAAANALEDELGAQVQAKEPAMSGDYEAARTKFAKIQNAEDSTTGGLIDAADYRRLAENNPRLLTGNSRLVALAGGELPAVTRLPTAGADVSPVKGTLYDTVMNAAARGAAKLPGVNITRPSLQARVANAAPPPGPLPTGPYPRGVVQPAQAEMLGPNGDLTPPPGVVTPGRTPPREPITLEETPGAYGVSPSDAARLQGPQQLGFALAPRREPVAVPPAVQRQMKLRDERAQQPGGGTTPTAPIPEPFSGAQPPEGQLPKRLGDYIRYLMEHGPAPRGSNGE